MQTKPPGNHGQFHPHPDGNQSGGPDAINGNQVHFLVRNERAEWNVARFIQEALADSGFGCGHQDMGGGLIPNARLFDKDQLYAKMRTLLNQGEKN